MYLCDGSCAGGLLRKVCVEESNPGNIRLPLSRRSCRSRGEVAINRKGNISPLLILEAIFLGTGNDPTERIPG